MPRARNLVEITFSYKKQLDQAINDIERQLSEVEASSTNLKNKKDNKFIDVEQIKRSLNDLKSYCDKIFNSNTNQIIDNLFDEKSFNDFKLKIIDGLKEIDNQVTTLDVSLGDLKKEFTNIGSNFSVEQVITKFNNLNDVVNSIKTNISEIDFSKIQTSFSVSNDNSLDTSIIKKQTDTLLKQYQKLKKIKDSLADRDADAFPKYQSLNKETTEILSPYQNNTFEYFDKLDQIQSDLRKKIENQYDLFSNKDFEDYNLAIDLATQYRDLIADINNTISVANKLNNKKTLLNLNTEQRDAIFDAIDEYKTVIQDDFVQVYDSFIDNQLASMAKQIDLKNLSDVTSIKSVKTKSTSKKAKVINEQFPEQIVQIKAELDQKSLDNVRSELNQSLEKLQSNLQNKPIIAPVRIRLDNDYSRSQNPDKTTTHRIDEAQQALSQTDSLVFADVEKLYNNTLKMSVNYATKQAKEALTEIKNYFKDNKIALSFQIDEESKRQIQNEVLNINNQSSNADNKKQAKNKSINTDVNNALDITATVKSARKELNSLYIDFNNFLNNNNFGKWIKEFQIETAKELGSTKSILGDSIILLDEQDQQTIKDFVTQVETLQTKITFLLHQKVEIPWVKDIEQSVDRLHEILNTLQNLTQLVDENQSKGLKNVISQIQHLNNIDSDNIDKIAIAINKLITPLQSILNLNISDNIFNNLKFSKANVTNIENLANSLELLKDKLNEINNSFNTNNSFLKELNNLVQYSEELRNLASILKSSSQKIKEVNNDIVNGNYSSSISNDASNLSDNYIKSANKSQGAWEQFFDYVQQEQKKLSDEFYQFNDKKAKWDGRTPDEYYRSKFEDYINNLVSGKEAFTTSSIQINTDNQHNFKNATLSYYNDLLKQTVTETWTWNQQTNELILTNKKFTDNLLQNAKAQDRFSQKAQASIDRLKKSINNTIVNDNKEINQQINELNSAAKHISTQDDLDIFNNRLTKLKTSIQEIIALNGRIKITTLTDEENVDKFTSALSKARFQLKTMGDVTKELSSPANFNDKGIAKFTGQVRTLTGELRNVEFVADAVHNTLSYSFVDTGVTQAITGIGRAVDSLKDKSDELFTYWTANLLNPYEIFHGFSVGVDMVRELDDAMTEMRKVSEEPLSILKEYQKESYDLAVDVGTTALTLQQSTADWMRLGETLSDASQSAQVSNILLNVSEFGSIADATDALVSMSQAYTELDKLDIVDKLNNIGNKYSIATDGIATALQDSASALRTAGNDIDESIALITAGNAIVQDPNSVGAGMRTIALRLTGTKEAQQQLSDLGEDTDGLVTTASKLRDVIMSATKVESNLFQGFDILDENGNFKSTYEILQGIADVYNEIVETDKRTGNNNVNLLLETIAGKNRANIAASILQNPEMLRSVFQDSKNSAGSAMQELSKYQDSISGSFARLTNETQKFWSTLIDSEDVKFVTNNLTLLLSLLTKLVDAMNSIPFLIGTGAAGLSLTGKASIFTVIKDQTGESISQIGLLGKSIDDIKHDLLTGQGLKFSFFQKDVVNQNDLNALKNYINAVKNIEASSQVVNISDIDAQKQQAFNKELSNTSSVLQKNITLVDQNSQSLQNLYNGLKNSTTGAKAANIAIKGLSIAMNTLAVGLISIGVSKFIEWMIDLSTASEQAREAAQNLTNEYIAQQDSINGYIQQYEELMSKLRDSSITFEAERSIKEELQGVQEQLIEAYGLEVKGLDLVNGRYATQIELLQQLSKEKAQDYVNENYNNIQAVNEELHRRRYVSDSFKSQRISQDDIDRIQGYIDDLNAEGYEFYLSDSTDLLGTTLGIAAHGTDVEEMREGLNALAQVIQENEDHDSVVYQEMKALISNLLNDPEINSADYQTNLDTATEYAHAELISNNQYSGVYQDFQNATNQARAAIGSGVDITSALANYQQAEQELRDVAGAVQNLDEVIKQTASDVIDFSENVEENPSKVEDYIDSATKSMEGMISSINSLQTGFDSIDNIVTSMNSGDFDFSLLSEDNFTQTFNKYTEEYNALLQSIQNAPNDFEANRQAFNDLISAWINGSGVLDGVSEGTARMTEMMLENMNVSNASEVVSAALAQEKANVRYASEGLSNSLYNEILNLDSETIATDAATRAYYAYIAQKLLAKDGTLQTSQDISALYAIVSALGVAQTAWANYYRARANLAALSNATVAGTMDDGSKYYRYTEQDENGTSSTYLLTEKQVQQKRADLQKPQEDLSKAIEDQIVNIEYDFKSGGYGGVGGGGGSGGSGGSGSSSSSSEGSVTDWIERQLELLDNQRSKYETEASNIYDNFLGITQDEFNRAKELFSQNVLPMSDEMNELMALSQKAGMSIGEFYNTIQSGSWDSSRQSALSSIIEVDQQKLKVYTLQVEKYQEQYLQYANQLSDEYKNKIESGGINIEEVPGGISDTVENAIEWFDKLSEAQQSQAEMQQQYWDDISVYYDNYAEALESANSKLEASNQLLENQISYMQASGQIISATSYENLIDNIDQQISNSQDIIASKRKKLKAMTDAGIDPDSEAYDSLQTEILDAQNNLLDLKIQQEEYNKELREMPINNMSTVIGMYSDISDTIQNWGAEFTATGQKLDLEYYQTLINNGATMIDQYQEQVRLIEDVMDEYEVGSDNWNDLYSQLHNTNSEISSMVKNLKEWNDELLRMPLDKINNYTDNLQLVSEALQEVQNDYEIVLGAVNTAIDDEVERIEEEREAYEKSIEEQKQALQDKLDLLEEQNEKLRLQQSYEQALYDLQTANTQKTEAVIRDGEKVYETNADKIREAYEAVQDAKFEIEKASIQEQIDDLDDQLDVYNKKIEEQLDILEKIRDKWAEIAENVEKAQNNEVADQYLGSGWQDKVISGSDFDIFNLFKNSYETNAAQIEAYDKQINTTQKIYDLLEQYIQAYQAGNISFEETQNSIKTLLSQLNSNISALDNLDNVLNYAQDVTSSTTATAEDVLHGIQLDLDETAKELLQAISQYQENAGLISEYTSSWQQLTDNVAKMLMMMMAHRHLVVQDHILAVVINHLAPHQIQI